MGNRGIAKKKGGAAESRAKPVKGKRAARAPAKIPDDALADLVAWFRRQRRILPWREEPTLYRVWISEIMLQQTQVATVLPYFERFMATFPRVEDLAAAGEEAVMKAWAGLGYYSRARNLHAAAKEVVRRGGTERGFPTTKEDWLEIPGVGPYTAGAITSIALGLPEPIVDGNVERVFSRLRRLARSAGEAVYKEDLWELSRSAVTRAHSAGLSPSELNQGWMELGATVCTPKKPTCLLCPVRGDCAAFADQSVEAYPEKKKRAAWVELREERIVLVDLSRGKVYLEKTAPGEWRAGLWDFPAKQAGRKNPVAGAPFAEIETNHVVTHHKITRVLRVFAITAEKFTPTRSGGRWVSMRDPEVALGSAPAKGIRRILERFA